MKEIHIKISGKIAVCSKKYLISSNDNYVLVFDFDEEWNEHRFKTARIVFDGKMTDIVFEGNSVRLPKIPPCKELSAGVFCGNLSSTFARLGCIASCADADFEQLNPMDESQFEKIIEILNRRENRYIEAITFENGILRFDFSGGETETVEIFGTSDPETNGMISNLRVRLERLEELVGNYADSNILHIAAFGGNVTQESDKLKIGA